MTSTRLLFAAASLLLLSAGAARAQVEPTKPELNTLPPDRPVLDATPQPTTPRTPPRQDVPPPQPTPANPSGTFTPARPPQPNALPDPAKRPAPENVGTVKPEAPTDKPGLLPADKYFITGNPDLGFSSSNGVSFFNVGLAAMLGYRVTDRLALGPGIVYKYTSYGGYGFSNIGGRIFGQALITDNIFIHAEHEIMRAEVPTILIGVLPSGQTQAILLTERKTVNSTFGGLGYRQHMGSRAALDILLLYNFSYDTNYFLYGQPEFRFNLTFDLF